MEQNFIRNDVDSTNEGSPSEIMDPSKLNESKADKITDWKHEPQIVDLKADLQYARQENREQTTNVDGWLALRNASGTESGLKSKKPGRSSVQPKLIRKHNEWRYPALSEPFLNTDRMFEIKPRTHEDKPAADQNMILINWQFDTKMNKVAFIDRYVRTTVDEGTCILRVGWERDTEQVLVEKIIYDYFPMEPDDVEGLQMLQQATQLMMDEDPQYEEAPDSLKASVEKSAELGEPVFAKEKERKMVHETKVTKNQPSVNIVDVRNFFIDPSCEDDWQEAQFAIVTYEATKSALKKRKTFKNLNKVNWSANAIKSKLGDQDHVSEAPQDDSRINTDKAKVLVYEYWGLFDIHGDGIMSPIVVSWIGETIIQMEENPFPDRKHPFVIVPYMPILKSTMGEADASLLQDNQRILGAVTRGMIDLLGRSANAQAGYAKGFLDPVNRRRFNTGEDFEFNPNSDPKIALQQMVYPEIPNSALTMSTLQNQEAEGLSGVKGFSSGITGEAYGQVARGISGAMDAAGQRETSILRRLAEGMKIVCQKIVSMNQIFLEEDEVVRVTNGEFVEIKREDLAGNFDMKCSISTAKEDEVKSQDLGMMLQTQGPNMDPGLEQIILGEIADLKRMPHLAEQIRTYKPEPDPMQVKMQELEIAKIEVEIALEKAKIIKIEAEAEKIAVETELETSGTGHERTVEAQGAQARGNRDLEVTKSLLAGETPSGNIEAAVGFNKITEMGDERDTKLPPPPPPPLAPLQSQPQPGQVPLGSGQLPPQGIPPQPQGQPIAPPQ